MTKKNRNVKYMTQEFIAVSTTQGTIMPIIKMANR